MNFGSFKIYRTNYLSITFKPRFFRGSNFRRHGIGLAALTDKEGEYIQYNRFYLTYAYRLALSRKTYLSAGATIGLANNSIQGTNISPGGSSHAPDGNLGMWLYGSKMYMGISLNQILETNLKPIGETFRLIRNTNITAGKRFYISPFLHYSGAINVRFAPGFDMDPDVDFMHSVLLHNLFSAGFNYRHHKGLVVTFGLENIPFNQRRHAASGWFSYAIPFSKYVSGNIQTYEITFSYKMF